MSAFAYWKKVTLIGKYMNIFTFSHSHFQKKNSMAKTTENVLITCTLKEKQLFMFHISKYVPTS